MALHIVSPEADRLARDLAHLTGETITRAVIIALRARLDRIVRRKALEEIQERVSRLPRLDSRSDEDLLGYNESGLFD
jgi:antitoxin VapB